ncbi:MAG: universal stress protein [Gemmatimonadetes bacterium]|nr:universal stress protein [Gemmatimonadota bacterium]
MLPDIKTILYCTTLGPNTGYVFRYAWSIANRFDAKIVVLHVVETLTSRQRSFVEGYSGLGSVSDVIDRAEREAVERIPVRIEEFCRREIGKGEWRKVVCKILVADGKPAARILEQIGRTGADLVVIGAADESTVLENLIGSTARTLVKKSPVPVLTVQIPEGRQSLTLDI